MILNDNFFLNPPSDIDDLKELLRWAAQEGIGRPVNKDGTSNGQWTPGGLADAISQLDTGKDGIDLRTVQLWFEENDRGISSDNINRLAKVFGCDDAESTKIWRVALLKAKSRQGAKRKDKAKRLKTAKTSRSHRFALWLDEVFDGRNPLSLPIVVWAGLTGVGFLAFAFGLHSVSYEPVQNQVKQVGFLWAPSWTIQNLFFLPLYLMFVGRLLTYWKLTGRPALNSYEPHDYEYSTWQNRVTAFSVPHVTVAVICALFVFLFQWVGMYVLPIVSESPGNRIIEWNNISTVRPEVVSKGAAIAVTMFAFVYAATICFLFLTGQLILCNVAYDYVQLSRSSPVGGGGDQSQLESEVGAEILTGIIRCTILGLLMPSCIKIYVVYLKSDAANILVWIYDDVLIALGFKDNSVGWLGRYALGDFSSFLLVLTTLFVFATSYFRISRRLRKLRSKDSFLATAPNVWGWLDRKDLSRITSLAVVALLLANYFLVGQFVGFSILLAITLIVSAVSLYKPLREYEDSRC